MPFAKLFGNDDEQILVMIDEGDDGPEVKFFCKPNGLGVSSMAIGFEDSDQGLESAQECFERVDETMARSIASKIGSDFAERFNETVSDGQS